MSSEVEEKDQSRKGQRTQKKNGETERSTNMPWEPVKLGQHDIYTGVMYQRQIAASRESDEGLPK